MSEFPKCSERSITMSHAKCELGSFFIELQKKHDLTPSEMFSLLGQEIVSLANSCIRSERHTGE